MGETILGVIGSGGLAVKAAGAAAALAVLALLYRRSSKEVRILSKIVGCARHDDATSAPCAMCAAVICKNCGVERRGQRICRSCERKPHSSQMVVEGPLAGPPKARRSAFVGLALALFGLLFAAAAYLAWKAELKTKGGGPLTAKKAIESSKKEIPRIQAALLRLISKLRGDKDGGAPAP